MPEKRPAGSLDTGVSKMILRDVLRRLISLPEKRPAGSLVTGVGDMNLRDVLNEDQ
jgi:hypothetical protein